MNQPYVRQRMTKVFIGGIIQGSIKGLEIHEQDYRSLIKDIFGKHAPECELYCPIENHPNSLEYDFERGREVFLSHVEMAAASDIFLAFIPQASMGTAVEMWEAHRRGAFVLTITPMVENWAVKFLSDKILADLDELTSFLAAGGLRVVAQRNAARR